MADWIAVTCEKADEIRRAPFITAYGGRSDLGGTYGEPEVYTEWGIRGRDIPLLREHRFPGLDLAGPDRKPCEHYAPADVLTP